MYVDAMQAMSCFRSHFLDGCNLWTIALSFLPSVRCLTSSINSSLLSDAHDLFSSLFYLLRVSFGTKVPQIRKTLISTTLYSACIRIRVSPSAVSLPEPDRRGKVQTCEPSTAESDGLTLPTVVLTNELCTKWLLGPGVCCTPLLKSILINDSTGPT